MKRTPWFSWSDMPTRVGWYDYRGPGLDGYRDWWNGRLFTTRPLNGLPVHPDASDQWRGLTAPTKGKK